MNIFSELITNRKFKQKLAKFLHSIHPLVMKLYEQQIIMFGDCGKI